MRRMLAAVLVGWMSLGGTLVVPDEALALNSAILDCAWLARTTLLNSTLVSSVWVPISLSAPAHCHVTGYVTTGNAQEGFNRVNFVLNLPRNVLWNSRLYFGGNGGFAGSVQADLLTPLRQGYAAAGTDTGHQASALEASWAQDSPTKVTDFGHQGVHVSVVAVKEIVEKFYGRPAAFSYFVGCSRGGGQALMEAQRYPGDFHGIVAGAPAFFWSRFMTGFAWNQVALYPDRTDLALPALPLAKLAYVEAQVNANCDADDGIEDGIIDDPRTCSFDPDLHLAVCAAGHEADTDCLTASELTALKAIYAGPSTSTGGFIWHGFPVGGEGGAGNWDVWIVGAEGLVGAYPNLQYDFGGEFFKYMAYPAQDDGSFEFHDFNFDTDLPTLDPIGAILDARDPNLDAFDDLHGKLLIWHGWSDAAVTALGTIDYFDRVGNQLGTTRRDGSVRLYMLPGVYHCGGGPGPSLFDPLKAVVDWVELGIRPDALVASHVDDSGQVDMTRLLCPYPQVARLIDPDGSTTDASNFQCVTLP